MQLGGGDRGHLYVFFQAEDGIRDYKVTGVQTCALPISGGVEWAGPLAAGLRANLGLRVASRGLLRLGEGEGRTFPEIGRAAGRGRGEISGGGVSLKKKKKTVLRRHILCLSLSSVSTPT